MMTRSKKKLNESSIPPKQNKPDDFDDEIDEHGNLKDFIDYDKKLINVESIQNVVASYFNLNIHEMLSPRRSRSLARPRQIAMYLAKQYTTNSLPDIGRKFSNRDHTTVNHAVKKIDELMKKDNEIKQSVAEIKKRIL